MPLTCRIPFGEDRQMEHIIRTVRAEEWEKVRELRLAALQDPAAPIAFLETYEQASQQPPDFWRGRAGTGAAGESVLQFVAEAPDGRWDGTVTVLVERASTKTLFGDLAAVEQTHLVGVYVRPGARGSGLIEALFRAAVEWSWDRAEPRTERVRLIVHERNGRAEAVYRRFGFRPSGATFPVAGDPTVEELEFELLRGGGLSR
jgi:GNAT superfamily N-acetyltransferase